MAKLQNPLKNVRLVLQPGNRKLKITLTCLILCGMAALAALAFVIRGIQAQTQEKLNEAAVLEYENSRLEEQLQETGDAQNVLDIAREELGLVDPDTVFLTPNQ